MRILHVMDSPQGGGATVAAYSVLDLVGGFTYRHETPGRLQQAHNTIGGYCSRGERARMGKAIEHFEPDVVHLHNFKEFGTGAIAGCLDAKVPVVWSCYDYWCLCPRDNGYDCCGLENCSWRKWSPAKGRDYPTICKLPLIGRARRIRKWMSRLDGIICLSQNSAGILGRLGPLPTRGIDVIPLPITLPEYSSQMMGMPVKLKKQKNLVVYLGGPHKAKGIDIWNQVVAKLKVQRPEIECWDIRVSSRPEALDWIAKAQVLVVLDQWPNPGPVVIREAQLLGTRVVASDIGGIKETAGNLGRTPRVGDSDHFCKHILSALNCEGINYISQPGYEYIKSELMRVYECAIS